MKLADYSNRLKGMGPRPKRIRDTLRGVDVNAALHLLVTVDVIAAFHQLITNHWRPLLWGVSRFGGRSGCSLV